jgi:hypothetical protein
MNVIQHCFICHPSDSTVSEDARIEPTTVATLADALTTRLDLIPHQGSIDENTSHVLILIRPSANIPKDISKSAIVACVQAVLGIRWAIGLYKYARARYSCSPSCSLATMRHLPGLLLLFFIGTFFKSLPLVTQGKRAAVCDLCVGVT